MPSAAPATPPPANVANPPSAAPRIVANRTVPSVTPPSLRVQFADMPSVRDLSTARVLPELLHPTGEPTPRQNHDLARALEQFAAQTDRLRALDALETFAGSADAGAWQATLLANVATLREQSGFYARAASLWDEAWALARYGDTGDAHLVADYAVGKRLWQASMFGQISVLEARLTELDARPVRGTPLQDVSFARESLAFLVYHHEQAVFSGPEALKALLAEQNRLSRQALGLIAAYHPSHEGTSLVALAALGRQAGAVLEMRHIDDAEALPIPAIVHLRSNHYSAIVAREPGGFKLRDPALGGEVYLSAAALRDEMSGYVLMPAAGGNAPGRSVGETEAASVVGHCFPGGPKDDDPCDCWRDADGNNAPPPGEAPGAGPGSGSAAGPACGMPIYALHPMSASVLVTDAPLRYDPPRGPAIEFRLRYSQRSPSGGGPAVGYGNVGARWRHDWTGYVLDNNSSTAAPYVWTDVSERGEGSESYNSYTGNTHWRTRATLTQVSQDPPRYERALPDGSLEVYTFPDRGPTLPNRKIFLTQVIDPRGQAISFTYDATVRLVAVTDALGQVTTLDYQDPASALLLTKVTDPFGRTATMAYNSIGQLVSVTDAIGMTSRFAYDETDFMRAMITPYGTTQFRNDDLATGVTAHRALVATDAEGASERIEYWATSAVDLPATAPTSEVPTGFSDMNQSLNLFNSLYWGKQAMEEAPGDRSRAVITRWLVKNESGYDPHAGGRSIPHSVKRPLESRVWYRYPSGSYNGVGIGVRPSQIARVLDDGSTQLQQFAYNTRGLLTAATDAAGRQRTYTYDTNNIDLLQVRQATAAGSDLLATLSGYTAQHLPSTVTDAAGQSTAMTYNAAGQMLTVTNAKAETTTYAYDSSGYLTSVTGPMSATVTYAYDGYGRVQTVTQPDGYAVATTYDALNRVTRATYPDGTFDAVTYDKLDVGERTDRAGRVTRYFYNRSRQLTAVRDPLGRVVRQEWCGCGQLTALVDGNDQRTVWTRDARGRVATEVRADAATTAYTYDLAGRVHTVTDPKGQITTYSYTLDGQIATVAYTNATVATPGVTFTYDAAYPRTTTMVDGIGTTTYTYKTPGQLGAGQTATVDGALSNDVIAYTYDELGRVLTRTINGSANSVTWSFDALGRVTNETNVLGSFAYTYDGATPRVATATYPNGQTTTYTYRPTTEDARLQTIQHRYPGGTTLSQFDYTYDAVGNIRTWRQQADATAVQWTYGYDAADQLVQAVKATTAATPTILQRFGYEYDAAANRTAEQIDDVAMGATHNSRNELVSQQPGGALVFAGTVNEPASVSLASRAVPVTAAGAFTGSAAVGGGTSTVVIAATDSNGNTATQAYSVTQTGASKTYTYDANGNMTGDGTRTFEWDAENRLVAVNIGTHRSEFSYDGLWRRARSIEKESGAGVGAASLLWDSTRLIEERLDTSEVNRFFDASESHNGTARYLTRDHLGSIRQVTDAAGAVVTQNEYDPYGRLTRVGGTEDGRFGYTGQYEHRPSGLTLAPLRGYDAGLARWSNEDPIGLLGGTNLYAYVENSPLVRVDPMGLCSDPAGSDPPPVRTPARGEPNTTDRLHGPGGNTTDRTYGPDGRAIKDIDRGHDHGVGDPHAHDWDWTQDRPRRPGRPLTPDEAAKVATYSALLYWIISEGSRVVFPPRNLLPIP